MFISPLPGQVIEKLRFLMTKPKFSNELLWEKEMCLTISQKSYKKIKHEYSE